MTPPKIAAYWQFKIKVVTSNAAKPTAEIKAAIINALSKDEEIVEIEIKEDYS